MLSFLLGSFGSIIYEWVLDGIRADPKKNIYVPMTHVQDALRAP